MLLPPKVNQALIEVSRKLGIEPGTLDMLITFESKWNPKAANPYSSAKGLIQFVNMTARDLGFASSQHLVNSYPTVIGQLKGPVYKYLAKHKPFRNDQSLFMAVFYPRAKNWPLHKEFPQYVQKVNPGIRTVNDYMQKVYKKLGLTKFSPLLILLGIGVFYILKNRKG